MGERYSKLINGLIFHTSDTGGLIFDTKKKADKVKYLVKNICEKDYKVRIIPAGRKYQLLTHPKLSSNDSWLIINHLKDV